MSAAAIRRYDYLGLIGPPGAPGQPRRYTEADLRRVTVLRDLAPLDFSLSEKRLLLKLLDDRSNRLLTWRERADVPIKLEMYREIAGYRISALRQQLAAAEAFAKTLELHTQESGNRPAAPTEWSEDQ